MENKDQQLNELNDGRISEGSRNETRKCSSEVFTCDGKDDELFETLEDKRSRNGLLSDRTKDNGSESRSNKKNFSESQKKTYINEGKQQFPDLKHYQRTTNGQGIFQKLKRVFKVLFKLSAKFQSKLIAHFSKTLTSDKYIRLVYSILKLFKVINPSKNLSFLSKELLNTRRIIQWQTKYQLVKQFMTQQLSPFQVGYKTLQLSGTLFDFSSFWLHLFSDKSPLIQNLAQIIYQWQDDCYFYQCFIQLILSTKNLINCLVLMKKENHQDHKIFQFKHHLTVLRQQKDLLLKKIKLVKKIQKQNENEKQTQKADCIIEQTLKNQLQVSQTEIHRLIKDFKLSSHGYKRQIEKEAYRNSLKIVKYICDSITSFNNCSRKTFNLNPTFGALLSILSSILSLLLIWIY